MSYSPTTPPHEMNPEALHNERWELIEHLNRLLDKPIIALAFVWLGLLIIDLTSELNPFLRLVSNLIWGIFIFDFLLEFVIAPSKGVYLRRNWLTAVSLLLPALRIFSLFRALRALQAARAVRTVSLLRVLTSLNRGMRATAITLGKRGIGYVVAVTFIVVFAGAAGMTAFESPNSLRESGVTVESESEGLNSYGESVWFTAMLMTTLGSEYWPQTAEGRLLCWLLSLYGLAVFGYITASIASYFVGIETPGKKAAPESTLSGEEVAALRQQIAALSLQLEQLSGQNP